MATNKLTPDSVVIRNMKGAMYKKTTTSLDSRVVSMATVGNYVLIGSLSQGCKIYSVRDDGTKLVGSLGDQPGTSGGSTCYDIAASTQEIVFIKEEAGQCSLCVHMFHDVLQGITRRAKSCDLRRRAPMVVDFQIQLIAIGAGAWKDSWVGSGGDREEGETGDESYIRTLSLDDLSVIAQWKAVDNSVAVLRLQTTDKQSMLGISDTRSGLKVVDLSQPKGDSYVCLYHLPVEEIRNFALLGNFIGVFHKFEPNVSFWNMAEQKTILCINIQDQMRHLAEDFLDPDADADTDSGLCEDEEDHVTCVTSVPYEDDVLLLYGTLSGCIFGMAVDTRTKLFSIPFAHESSGHEKHFRRDVLGLAFIPRGKLVACYEGHGLTVLDFSPENPPDRPPTRGIPK